MVRSHAGRSAAGTSEPEKRPEHIMTSHAGEHEQHDRANSPPGGHAAAGTHIQPPSPAAGSHEDHRGHDRHAGHSVEMFRDRFWTTLALTIPTLASSHTIQEWFRFSLPAFPGSTYLPAVF